AERRPPEDPRFFDFSSVAALREAERTFYRVGVGPAEARRVLDGQLGNLEELARYFVAYVSSVVLDDLQVVNSRACGEGIDLEDLRFAPEAIRARYEPGPSLDEPHAWTFDTGVLERLRAERGPILTAQSSNGVVHA